MYIKSINVKLLSIPLDKSITTNIHSFDKIECLVLILTTNSGITDQGFIRGLGKTPSREIKDCIVKDWIPRLITEKTEISLLSWQALWKSYHHSESAAEIYALAVVDIAIWDIFAKEKNKPLHQLLGVVYNKIPVYGTTGWLSLSLLACYQNGYMLLPEFSGTGVELTRETLESYSI